jgi:hypothetical protein
MNSAWDTVYNSFSAYKERFQISLGGYYPQFLSWTNKLKSSFSYIVQIWPITGEYTLAALALLLIGYYSYRIGKGHSINVDEYISKIELNKTYEKSLRDTE